MQSGCVNQAEISFTFVTPSPSKPALEAVRHHLLHPLTQSLATRSCSSILVPPRGHKLSQSRLPAAALLHWCVVIADMSSKGPFSRYVLVVDNLSSETRSKDIAYEFEAAGPVRDIARDYKARCALVEFGRYVLVCTHVVTVSVRH